MNFQRMEGREKVKRDGFGTTVAQGEKFTRNT